MNLQSYPFASQRMPLMATNGLVATSQPLAAQAGLRMLQQGGNAIDAAIATAAALTVLEPTSNGMGGDAFALVWDGNQLHGLNGSGPAPLALQAADLRAQGYSDMPTEGWLPVTVPGTPAAWGELHQKFAQLPLEELFAPAIAYAENGYGVTPIVAHHWAAEADRFLSRPEPMFAEWGLTFAPQGRAPRAGERWASPKHAQTLRTLAARGCRDFYEGELAAKILDFATSTAGLFQPDDLAGHHSQWVEPLSQAYRDYEVWEIPPNGQGLTALMALAILEGLDLPSQPHGSEEMLHWQIEAMKLAFADAQHYIADPTQIEVPIADLLDPAYIAMRRTLIGPEARQPAAGEPPHSDTVYLCTADGEGRMVSYIQSNYMGFGSGLVVPDTGIALHNRGACFSLAEGHANEAHGGKRPYHTIIPGFLTRQGEPVGPFGVMGGYMQPQGHTQVIINMVDYGLNPQATLDAPRWQVTGGLSLNLEYGFPEHIVRGLAARGHDIQRPVDRATFGRGQIIWRLADGVMVAGSDMRADGAVVGW